MGDYGRGADNPALADVGGKSLPAQGHDLPPQGTLVPMLGTSLRPHDHGRFDAKAQQLRPGLRARYAAVLPQGDVLALPTPPLTAHADRPPLESPELITHGGNRLGTTAPVEWTGHPALSLPCATSDGLPVGLRLTGRPCDEATVLAVAQAFEPQVAWETRGGLRRERRERSGVGGEGPNRPSVCGQVLADPLPGADARQRPRHSRVQSRLPPVWRPASDALGCGADRRRARCRCRVRCGWREGAPGRTTVKRRACGTDPASWRIILLIDAL
jgi:hypothetical protein